MCFKQYQKSKNFGQLLSDSGPLCIVVLVNSIFGSVELMSCGLHSANCSSVCRFVIYFGETLFCLGLAGRIIWMCVVLLWSAMEVVMGTVVLLKVLHFISLFNVRYL